MADRRDDDSMTGETVLDLMMVMEEGNPATIRTEENEANSEKHERTKTPLKTLRDFFDGKKDKVIKG